MKSSEFMLFMDITDVSLIEKALDVLMISEESETMGTTDILNIAKLSSKLQLIRLEMKERRKNMKSDTEIMIENLQHNILQLADVCKRIQEENNQLRLELDEANDLLHDSYRYEDQLEVEIAAACTALEDHKKATVDFIEELTNCRPFGFEELAILNKYKEMLI